MSVPNMAPNSRRLSLMWLGILLVCAIAYFWFLGVAPLFDLDEALYVTCAKQMTVSHDFITPRLNTHPSLLSSQVATPFFEKPILVYWVTILSFKLFGISELSARLPIAFMGLLTTLLLTLLGVRWFGRRAGFLAGIVFATAPISVLDARQMTTDGLLVLWFTGAMLSFAKLAGIGETTPLSKAQKWGYGSCFWVCCALAILTKGAVGLLLPLLVIGVFFLGGKREGTTQIAQLRQGFGKLSPILGLLLCLLIAIPWHISIAKLGEQDAQGRTFVQEYLIRQHIGRFRGGDTVHAAPLPTYIAYFLVGFFPWACFVPSAFRRRLPNAEEPSEGESEKHRFLLVWFWTIFLFFTISSTKLPTYIAPTYPAAALLLGRWLDKALAGGADKPLRWGTFTAFLVALILAGGVLVAPHFVPANAPIPPAILALVSHITFLLAGGCFLAWVFSFSPKRRRASVGFLTGTMLCFVLVGVTEGYPLAKRDLLGTYQRIAQGANATAEQEIPVLYYHIIPRRPSMLFYSNYSPYERKETPIAPALITLLEQSPQKRVLVITSLRTWETLLQAELKEIPNLNVKIEERTGEGREGWIRLLVQEHKQDL